MVTSAASFVAGMADDGFLRPLAPFRVPILVVWHTTFAVVSVAWHFPSVLNQVVWHATLAVVSVA